MVKELHDWLLTQKPETSDHDVAACVICNPGAAPSAQDNPADAEGGSVSDTYTEEELAAKVAEATAALEAKVKALETAQVTTEVEAKLAEAKAEADAKIAELQTQLDVAVAATDAAKTEKDALVAYLEAEVQAAAEAAAKAARRDERLAKIKEAASYSEERLEANADRWAAMDEDAFEALLADLNDVAAKKTEPGSTDIPSTTAMTAGQTTTTGSSNVLKEVLNFRRDGVDPRTLR